MRVRRRLIQRVAKAERREANALDARIDQRTKVANVFERCAAAAEIDQTPIGRCERGGHLLNVDCLGAKIVGGLTTTRMKKSLLKMQTRLLEGFFNTCFTELDFMNQSVGCNIYHII